jgi:hypothetical protein
VSGAAQPYEPVAGIPPASWLHAFDLDVPLPSPAPPPSDLTPIDVTAGPLHFFGMAAGPGDSNRDRYIFYAEPTVPYSRDRIVPVYILFSLADGSDEFAHLDPRRMVDPADFTRAWFSFTLSGPPRAKLSGLQIEGIFLPLP